MQTFQDLFLTLESFWKQNGCTILPAYDRAMGAGTFHPEIIFGSLGPDPFRVAFTQPCRRPGDGRYGDNPNRLQKFHQFQVLLKPAPSNIRYLMLESFQTLGIDLAKNDIRFVEDDWESPTIGATGLGWEVWLNGMEVLQFTYFQKMGGLPCAPVCGELAYGLERLALGIQKKDSIYDLLWSGNVRYGDLFKRDEKEFSTFYFEKTDPAYLQNDFDCLLNQGFELLKQNLTRPAYDLCIKAIDTFNLLEARGALSVNERAGYITKVRELACACCQRHVETLVDTPKEDTKEGTGEQIG